MNIDIIRNMLDDCVDDERASKILNAVEELVKQETNIIRRDYCDLYDLVSDHCYDILDNTTYQETYTDYRDLIINK